MQNNQGYFVGQLLVAMPHAEDQRFGRTVIYLCAHSAEGAMGLVLNRVMHELTFDELLSQLHIPKGPLCPHVVVHAGGPVESSRGFVLHTSDYLHANSTLVADDIALTTTVDILRVIADGEGPKHLLLALGYAGWGAGQLENELRDNAWLVVPPDLTTIFEGDLDTKWEQAIHKLVGDVGTLSAVAGHA